MLTMNIDELDLDVAMIVCFVHVKMLKLLAAAMETSQKEADSEDVDGEEEEAVA